MKPLTKMSLSEIRKVVQDQPAMSALVLELLRRCEEAEKFRLSVVKDCEKLLKVAKGESATERTEAR